MQHYVSNVFQFKKQVSKKNKTVQADNAQGSSASQGHRTAAMHELEMQVTHSNSRPLYHNVTTYKHSNSCCFLTV